jgi:ATP-dependent Clp protease ATP-binding subunit ClpC
MFERYTEQARRVLFFARYEASQLGSISIETEHLLLGLIREDKGLTGRILAQWQVSFENLRNDIVERTIVREKAGTSVEIPFSAEAKRALQAAADEADNLLHNHIGPEHLLLGLLREESSVAGSILRKNDLELAGVRDHVSAMFQTPSDAEARGRANVAEELEQVKALVDRIAKELPAQEAARGLIEEIRHRLERLQERFNW